MASEGNDAAVTSAQNNTTKPWCSLPEGDDLFSHAHLTLLKGDAHPRESERAGRNDDEERGVKERKRKRQKERIRHIRRTQGNLNVSVQSSDPLLVSSDPLAATQEGLPPLPSTGPPAGGTKLPARLLPGVPPLLPLSLAPTKPPPASPSPPPRPHTHSPTQTPPLTRSSPPSPTPFKHSPSPTRQPSPPASRLTTPSASPPSSPPCLTPIMEDTEEEARKRKKKVCGVCGDVARSLHFGGRACDSCKAFFRRAVTGGTFPRVHLRTVCVCLWGQETRGRKETRFSRCLSAGMEVSLVSREDEGPRGLPHTLGLYRRLSRHSHAQAKTLHGAPYLPGCWRAPYGSAMPVLTPRLKEEPRYSPTGGEAAQQRRVTHSSHDPSLDAAPRPGHELPTRHAHERASPRGHAPAPRQRHPPPHPRLPPATTHVAFRQDPPQGHPPSAHFPTLTTLPSSSGTANLPRWLGTAATPWRPDLPGGDGVGGGGGGRGGRSAQKGTTAPLQAGLSAQDLAEIKQLQEFYVGEQEAEGTSLEQCVPRSELGQLYMCFIERRAKFLASTPLYATVVAADRPRLLHVAVAMSTYFTGAHHIDTSDYSWPQRRGAGPAGREVAVLAASSIRQLLSHQQFLHVMKFYTTYSEALADQTTAVLVQVMSLFYPEEGLQAPRPVEEGRLHYLALLSRYLVASHGPREGARRLATLLTSQQEARQLVDLLRQVDLTPREPGADLATSRAMMQDRIHLVCQAARVGRARRGARGSSEGSRPSTPLSRSSSSPEAGGGTLEQVGSILSRLAQCEDPHTLAEARRILPAPLLQRFLHLLLSAAPRTPPQCTPPSPSPSPPSPQCRKLGITRHAGEPPPPAAEPRPLHHLSAVPHAPELAAE
ncbi:hypothetical protein O3P69_015936 [Scylla paramamosain]|uniref:Nuclear receptor domain-containing protein n=1 Tax=Scylla paramamosain TaxID=85552 RepID=A0AAW0T873_SCYPA